MRPATALVLAAALLASAAVGRAQDSTQASLDSLRTHPPRERFDSVDFDTMMFGPRYTFTGREDPHLLAGAFLRIPELILSTGRRGPATYCLALGRGDDPPPALVLALLDQGD